MWCSMRTRFADAAQHADAYFVIRAISTEKPNASKQAHRQWGGRGAMPPRIFVFAPPDFFLAPHGIFLSWCFWAEKRLNLRFWPKKAFAFRRKPLPP